MLCCQTSHLSHCIWCEPSFWDRSVVGTVGGICNTYQVCTTQPALLTVKSPFHFFLEFLELPLCFPHLLSKISLRAASLSGSKLFLFFLELSKVLLFQDLGSFAFANALFTCLSARFLRLGMLETSTNHQSQDTDLIQLLLFLLLGLGRC